jgi:signal transduction histidine kinase
VTRVQRALVSLDQRLHFVAGELRPAALDLGIAVALEHFVRQWSATFGVPVTFRSQRLRSPVRCRSKSRRTSTGSLRKP